MPYILVILSVIVLMGTVNAAEYWVATTGNDKSGVGSEPLPWGTIQYGVDQLDPGDILLVRDGNYQGFLVRRNGTAINPITIKAANNSVYITSDSGIGDDFEERITINNSSYVIIDGFNIPGDHTAGNGIGAHGAKPSSPMYGIIIRNNTVHDIGSGTAYGNTGIYVSHTNGALIENNTIYNSGEHGIYVANAGAKNTIVRGNRIYSNGTNGIHMNGDLSTGGDGSLTGLLLTNNIIYDNGQNGINMDGVQDSTISNNIVYKNARHGVAIYRIDGAAGPKNITIVNNTFDSNNDWAVRFSEDQGGHTIFNNILLSRLGSIRTNSNTVASTYSSNYNISSNKYSTNGGETTISLATWQTNTSNDLHSIDTTADENFNNELDGDYTLKNGAPAINVGTAHLDGVAAPTVDISGVSRPVGIAHDIGAHEWVSTQETPIQAPTGFKVWLINP
jgi:parallel beta-helix repeat protein